MTGEKIEALSRMTCDLKMWDLKSKIKRAISYIGPGFLVSVGYMDPGNWATNISGGSYFGYKLLWVIFMSNIMAIILQIVAAKVGIATGRNLAELCREYFPKSISFVLWIFAQISSMATDLAEFLGAAIALNILFSLSMLESVFATFVFVIGITGLSRYGHRIVEIVIIFFVSIVGISYIMEFFLISPDWNQILHNVFIPSVDSESILIAVGMLGATVMPHNIFLHSDIILKKFRDIKDYKNKGKFLRFAIIDSILALNVAWLINSSMIIISSAVFYKNGIAIDSIKKAYVTLSPSLGSFATFLFALALLSSGLSSSTTGTMAGQGIIEGFGFVKIPLWLRRTITMIPSIIIISLNVSDVIALIVSQVILSLSLPFAVIPLIVLSGRRDVMGELKNGFHLNGILWIISGLIISLNIVLIYLSI